MGGDDGLPAGWEMSTDPESGRPFYINLWPDDVHSPFFPPEVLRDETDGSKVSKSLIWRND